MAKKAKLEEPLEEVANEKPEAMSAKKLPWDALVAFAYAEFVKSIEGDFPPWDNVPDEAKGLYQISAAYVRVGNDPRSEFEQVVKRLLKDEPAVSEVDTCSLCGHEWRYHGRDGYNCIGASPKCPCLRLMPACP